MFFLNLIMKKTPKIDLAKSLYFVIDQFEGTVHNCDVLNPLSQQYDHPKSKGRKSSFARIITVYKLL